MSFNEISGLLIEDNVLKVSTLEGLRGATQLLITSKADNSDEARFSGAERISSITDSSEDMIEHAFA